MTTLLVAPRAEAQIRAIQEWWKAERPAAPELFALELATALELLTELRAQELATASFAA